MLNKSTLKWIMVLICLIHAISSQNICQNCINTTNNFTCNNMYCSGFVIPSNNQYNFNTTAVMCNQANGANGGSKCFYPLTTNSIEVTYIFCNATIIGCAACLNQFVCNTCFNGFYLYTPNTDGSVINCQPCAKSIPGCYYCSSQSKCTQCFPGFILLGNTCSYLNFTLPNGLGLFTYEKGGSTVAQIIGAVLIFCILVIILIAVCIFFCKQKKRIPDFLNPDNQTSMEETIKF